MQLLTEAYEACEGQNFCAVEGTLSWPWKIKCPHQGKEDYLQMHYQCLQGKKHSQETLSCPHLGKEDYLQMHYQCLQGKKHSHKILSKNTLRNTFKNDSHETLSRNTLKKHFKETLSYPHQGKKDYLQMH